MRSFDQRSSSKGQFAKCSYCGAKIPILLDKIFGVSVTSRTERPKPKQITNKEKDILPRGFEDDSIPFADEDAETGLKIFAVIAALGLIILIPMVLVGFYNSGSYKSETLSTHAVDSPTQVAPPKPNREAEKTKPRSCPDFSYHAYVIYFTDFGIEDEVVPVIKSDQLPTSDLAVLKKKRCLRNSG